MSRGIEIAAFCNVAKDGELRTSQAGNAYGLVTLMTSSGNTDDQGRDIPAFLKCLAFGETATAAANLRKGQKVYVEGVMSVGIWQPADGGPKLDLSVKCSKLEPTQIGRNKPKREERAEYQRPLEQQPERPPFSDEIGF
jgi:single-stranded DNA-binding protein